MGYDAFFIFKILDYFLYLLTDPRIIELFVALFVLSLYRFDNFVGIGAFIDDYRSCAWPLYSLVQTFP